MAQDPGTLERVDHWLGRLRQGDPAARAALIQVAQRRLELMARRQLRGFPRLRRWEETGDLLTEAMRRLYGALEAVRPDTPGQFFALAGVQIRRQLLDLHRRYRLLAAKHESGSVGEAADAGRGQRSAEERSLGLIDELPAAEREVLDLLYVFGHTQAEAAELLGVCERTVRQRKLAAKLALQHLLQDRPDD